MTETNKKTPVSIDYSKYANLAETPSDSERRKFDYLAVSGKVNTEVIKDAKGEEAEKRLPATAIKLFLTKERDAQDNLQSEELALPLTIVPIKYRMVMEQRGGSEGELLLLKSSEFNGKQTDIVIINRFGIDGKIAETFGPMSVAQARKQFLKEDGKQALRDKAHVYSLHNGEVVRFVVKGTGLWEDVTKLSGGKTPASQAKYPFLNNYLSEFPLDKPYFAFNMEVGAAYRDHGSVKYYRPTFKRGAEITPEVGAVVVKHLEDLHAYFAEMDEATKNFKPQVKSELEKEFDAPSDEVKPEDIPFGE